jgi:hypothetical protein
MDADRPAPDLSVPESRFARAYAGLSDEQRAWLKTGIALLFEWHGDRRRLARSEAATWRGGLSSMLVEAPRDFAVLLCDETFASPAQLLAALVPALLSGVPEVVVLHVGRRGATPPALLAACELAGQEIVIEAGPRRAAKLLAGMCRPGRSGSVLILGRGAAAGVWAGLAADPARVRAWRPGLGRTASVWLEAQDDFDLEILAFAHPDTEFRVFGASPGRLPAGFVRGRGNFAACLAGDSGVVFAPAARAEEALVAAQLVLCPGLEGCFVWPDLEPSLFVSRRIGWDAAPDDGEGAGP